MKQWWLNLWGYKLKSSQEVRETWGGAVVGHHTLLLFEKHTKKGPRYKTAKIRGAWGC